MPPKAKKSGGSNNAAGSNATGKQQQQQQQQQKKKQPTSDSNAAPTNKNSATTAATMPATSKEETELRLEKVGRAMDLAAKMFFPTCASGAQTKQQGSQSVSATAAAIAAASAAAAKQQQQQATTRHAGNIPPKMLPTNDPALDPSQWLSSLPGYNDALLLVAEDEEQHAAVAAAAEAEARAAHRRRRRKRQHERQQQQKQQGHPNAVSARDAASSSESWTTDDDQDEASDEYYDDYSFSDGDFGDGEDDEEDEDAYDEEDDGEDDFGECEDDDEEEEGGSNGAERKRKKSEATKGLGTVLIAGNDGRVVTTYSTGSNGGEAAKNSSKEKNATERKCNKNDEKEDEEDVEEDEEDVAAAPVVLQQEEIALRDFCDEYGVMPEIQFDATAGVPPADADADATTGHKTQSKQQGNTTTTRRRRHRKERMSRRDYLQRHHQHHYYQTTAFSQQHLRYHTHHSYPHCDDQCRALGVGGHSEDCLFTTAAAVLTGTHLEVDVPWQQAMAPSNTACCMSDAGFNFAMRTHEAATTDSRRLFVPDANDKLLKQLQLLVSAFRQKEVQSAKGHSANDGDNIKDDEEEEEEKNAAEEDNAAKEEKQKQKGDGAEEKNVEEDTIASSGINRNNMSRGNPIRLTKQQEANVFKALARNRQGVGSILDSLPFVSAFIDIHLVGLDPLSPKPRPGATFLILGVLTQHLGIVSESLSLGADPNDARFLCLLLHSGPHTWHGVTPFQIACLSQNIEVMEALFAAGGSLHTIDRRGDTLLHWACYFDLPRTRQWLLSKGCPRLVPNNFYLLPGEGEFCMTCPAVEKQQQQQSGNTLDLPHPMSLKYDPAIHCHCGSGRPRLGCGCVDDFIMKTNLQRRQRNWMSDEVADEIHQVVDRINNMAFTDL